MRHAAAAALLLVSGCALTADVEIPTIALVLPQQSFPAASLVVNQCGTGDPNGCVQTDLDYDLGSQIGILGAAHTTSEVRLTDLGIELTAGASNLDGIASAKVEVVAPNGTDAVLVASYARPASASNVQSIAVQGSADTDLSPYLQSGKIHVRLKLTYDAPTPAFTADVRATFYVKVTYDYGHQL
ncbi:MAG TPA: hypothetical protein VML50_06035 [Anaeromyxobacter sp.]|nr:hypothetical protein [Anaeromyxobacter sp.]